MGFCPEVNGRVRTLRISADCRSALALVSVVVLIAVAGCATKRAKPSSSSTQHGADSSATASAGAKHEAKTGTAGHAAATPGPAGQVGATSHIRLTQHGCIQFEPQWCDIALGKPLTFHSDLKSPVTIHVSGGAFEKTEFVVRPGTTVSTGPAHATGSYSMWSEPAACQGAPLGAHGAGPGVTVEGAAAR